VLVLGIGLNILGVRSIRVGNLLLALVVAAVLTTVLPTLSGLGRGLGLLH